MLPLAGGGHEVASQCYGQPPLVSVSPRDGGREWWSWVGPSRWCRAVAGLSASCSRCRNGSRCRLCPHTPRRRRSTCRAIPANARPALLLLMSMHCTARASTHAPPWPNGSSTVHLAPWLQPAAAIAELDLRHPQVAPEPAQEPNPRVPPILPYIWQEICQNCYGSIYYHSKR